MRYEPKIYEKDKYLMQIGRSVTNQMRLSAKWVSLMKVFKTSNQYTAHDKSNYLLEEKKPPKFYFSK